MGFGHSYLVRRGMCVVGIGVLSVLCLAPQRAATAALLTDEILMEAQDRDAFPDADAVADKLSPETVLRLRVTGFAPYARGFARQCRDAVGSCDNEIPVQFDAQGVARFEYLVREDFGDARRRSQRCRAASAPCTVAIHSVDGSTQSALQTIFVDAIAPAGRITVTPSGPIPLDGATVTVHVFAFPPGAIVNAVMCRAPDAFGARCGLPGPSVPIVVGRDGSGRARLQVVPSEVGRSQASCFRGDPCGISVVSDTVVVRARVVPIFFAAPPGADYDRLRLSFGLGMACLFIGMCAWLIVRTDWSEVGEAKAPQIDNAEYADLDAIIAALPPEPETLATVS